MLLIAALIVMALTATAFATGLAQSVFGAMKDAYAVSDAARDEKYLAADGIENCMSILKELEDGKLNDIDFVELNACPGGCVGGVLNIENPFVAKAKIQTLRKYLPVTKSKLKDYGMTRKDVLWETEPEIVDIMQVSKDRGEAMRLLGEIEKVNKLLPQLDCGNCGAPSCRAFAEDVVLENIDINNCTKLNEK
ncbi:MAG: (Fe-S)-binding protein [Clostridia bacterium]